MLNRAASLAMSTSVLKALTGKLDIKDTHLVFSMYYTLQVFKVTGEDINNCLYSSGFCRLTRYNKPGMLHCLY